MKDLMQMKKAELVDVIQRAGIEVKEDTLLDEIEQREADARVAIGEVIRKTEELTGRRLGFEAAHGRNDQTFIGGDGFSSEANSLTTMVKDLTRKANSGSYTFRNRWEFTQWVESKIKCYW